jgi:hypothetical protein
MVKDPQALFADGELPLEAIDDSHAEGATLKGAALKIAVYLDKSAAGTLAVGDFDDMTRLFSPGYFNGDGVVPAALADDEALARALGEIIETQGGAPDRSGEPGITAETLEAFFTQVESVLEWRRRAAESAELVLPLGEATAAAAGVFDRGAGEGGRLFRALPPRGVRRACCGGPESGRDGLRVFRGPADRRRRCRGGGAAAGCGRGRQALATHGGVNPAWATRIAQLHDEVIAPVLGSCEALTQEQWAELSRASRPTGRG